MIPVQRSIATALLNAVEAAGFEFTHYDSFEGWFGYGWEVHLKHGNKLVAQSFDEADGYPSFLRIGNTELINKFLAIPLLRNHYIVPGLPTPELLTYELIGEKETAELIALVAEHIDAIKKI